jgi:glycosyltransferase involved in cell wall biosynthesis
MGLESRFPVTLVVPVRNEAATLGRLWESIQGQSRPPERIIFVDGGSTDQTRGAIRELAQGDSRVSLIETGGAMPGEGRNIGISAAETTWVALTDAGITLDRLWLESLVARVEREPALEVVYGSYEPVIGSFFEECAAISYVPPPWRSPATGGEPLRGPTITSTLLRRSVWVGAGGFPRWRAAEDLIFMQRIEAAGYRIGYAPAALVYWQLRPDLVTTWRKFALYSTHNVLAGMQAHWHYGIARHYAVYGATLTVATLFGMAGLMAVPLLGYLARAGRRLLIDRRATGERQKWNWSEIAWILNPGRVGLVVLILLAIDLATFAGWWRAWEIKWREAMK